MINVRHYYIICAIETEEAKDIQYLQQAQSRYGQQYVDMILYQWDDDITNSGGDILKFSWSYHLL